MITSIRNYDDRTVSFIKAKDNLWGMTKSYLLCHFEKQGNSRDRVYPRYNRKGELINTDLYDLSIKSEDKESLFNA